MTTNRFHIPGKVQLNVLLVFIVATLTIVLFVKQVSTNSDDTRATETLVNNAYSTIKQLESIRSAFAESQSATNGYIVTSDKRWRQQLHRSQDSMLHYMQRAGSGVTDPIEKQRLLDLNTLLQQKIAFQDAIVRNETISRELLDKINYGGEHHKLNIQVRLLLTQLMDRHEKLLQQRLQASITAKDKALSTTIFGTAIVFLFITAMLWRLNNDIRRRKRAQQQNRESESKYRRLIEDAGVTLFTTNREGIFTYVSGRCHELTGYTPDDLTGQSFAILIVPEWINKVAMDYGRQMESRTKETTFRFPIHTRTKELKWVEQHAVIVPDESGAPIGLQCVVKDITEAKLSEEKIKDANYKITAMLASTQEGFYMIAPDFSVIMINEPGRQFLKLWNGETCQVGSDILNFIMPERRQLFIKLFDRVMKGKKEEAEIMRDTDEGEKWYHHSYFPVRDQNDTVIAVCATSKDITEHKLTERALDKIRSEREEYQFRLQSILDNTPVIMFIKDLEGRYLIINKSFREAFGLNDRDVIGKTDFDIESPEDARRYKKVDEEVIETLQSVEVEETYEIRNEKRNLLLVKFPLFDKDKNIYGVGGIGTDFTDKVQYRQKLIEARKKAEIAEQLQEQFLANMSHEIRTPMNGIIGMTNILAGTALDSEQSEYVEIIRRSSDNLLFLINDILDLSKIKSGKIALEKTNFNIDKLLETTLAPFFPKAKERHISLVLQRDEVLPVLLQGDPYRLTQVLNNLMSNALKFTEKGSITVSVLQEPLSEKEMLVSFSVSDTGTGIPADKLDSIFNSFEQANSSTTRKFGGTGLGLAITKQLVEMQGGKVTVQSELNKGTVFSFALRYSYIQKDEQAAEPVPVQKANARDLAGKRILVAEDNEINQKVIFTLLKKEGIMVDIANNGREAVDRLEQGHSYDLIILDLQMPEMDGFQTSTYIRKKLQCTTPIIAMTASALRNEKVKCFELGMNEYLTKPFVPADLFAQLRKFLLAQPVATSQEENPAAKATTEVYNLSHLLEMEDNDYFCEVLQLFLNTTPTLLDEIKNGVLHENWEQVYKQAHKLKSSLGILQMNKMLSLVTTIELQAKEKRDTELINDELKQVMGQFELIRPMIEAELKTATTLNV